ncbi:kinase-like domain, phloem protein 2-like protein, partial [Tanacetum coccineum]
NHDDLLHLKIPLQNIREATNNFDEENVGGTGGFGNHYIGQLLWSGESIAIHAQKCNKEWDNEKEQQFWMEISMLSSLKHNNLVSLVGFCDENNEKIIIYKYESWISLDNRLSDSLLLTWLRRLEICVGVVHALSYIHYDEQRDFSVIHQNIESEAILLNDSWEPKLSEFRISIKTKASERHHSFHVDEVWDRKGYTDPTYFAASFSFHNIKKTLCAYLFAASFAASFSFHNIKKTFSFHMRIQLTVYKADLEHFDSSNSLSINGVDICDLPRKRSTVAIKRINNQEGEQGFIAEIETLTSCKHDNIISLLGFCYEGNGPMILVYDHALKGSLQNYLGSSDKMTNLTWMQRL